MKFAILTIPHTGTHFVLNLLGGTRDNLHDWMSKKFDANGHNFFVAHIYRLPVFEIMESEGYNIICPMRHPITTVRSWHDRYTKDPIEIPDEGVPGYVENLERYINPEFVPNLYKSLITADQLYDINFLPIDSPKREEFLQKLNEKLGLSLETEWRPLNSHGESTLDIPEPLLTRTKDLIYENPEFFGKFY